MAGWKPPYPCYFLNIFSSKHIFLLWYNLCFTQNSSSAKSAKMTLRAQAIMWLCGLLLTLSMVLAHDIKGHDMCDICTEDSTAVIQTMDNEARINSSLSKIQCFIYNLNLLSCSWSSDSLPENAHYSASFQFCSMPKRHPFNCVSDSSNKMVECQGQVNISYFEEEDVSDAFVIVNISINGYWYIICQYYNLLEIEKLDPPEIITTLIKSTNLEIQWLQTRSCCATQNKCFLYELKINNEIVALMGVLSYNLTNFEPTKCYTIQIRTKHEKACVSNDVWSDWSKAMVISPPVNTYQLNPIVIASIVLMLPMILLAFLLICKFQRLFEKLFPSIPNPSKNVEKLLERNYLNQDTPPKQSEEGAEILEVTD